MLAGLDSRQNILRRRSERKGSPAFMTLTGDERLAGFPLSIEKDCSRPSSEDLRV